MKMLRVALALLTGTATSLPPPPSCEHLQHAFGARGVARHEVPKTPVSGEVFFKILLGSTMWGRVSLVRQIDFFLSIFLKSKRRGKRIRNARKKSVPSFIHVSPLEPML